MNTRWNHVVGSPVTQTTMANWCGQSKERACVLQ